MAFIDLENIINQILNGKTKFDFDLMELLKSTAEKLLLNCFYIGYHLSNPEDIDSDTALAIHRIGNLSEYCFHTLDDLSLFSSSNKSQINQENVVIRYLYGTSSKEEKKTVRFQFRPRIRRRSHSQVQNNKFGFRRYRYENIFY